MALPELRELFDVNAVVGGYRDGGIADRGAGHIVLAAQHSPAERIVNCWPLERLAAWLSGSESGPD